MVLSERGHLGSFVPLARRMVLLRVWKPGAKDPLGSQGDPLQLFLTRSAAGRPTHASVGQVDVFEQRWGEFVPQGSKEKETLLGLSIMSVVKCLSSPGPLRWKRSINNIIDLKQGLSFLIKRRWQDNVISVFFRLCHKCLNSLTYHTTSIVFPAPMLL